MKLSPSLILLVLAALFAPIMGGQLSLDALGITDPSQALGSIFGSPEAPLLGHSILALFPLSALAFVLVSRRVLQVPNNWISGAMVIFLLLLTCTVSYSAFKSTSMIAALEWLTYGAIFYGTIAIAGRQKGPVVVLSGLAAGCTVVALLGIIEYGKNKAVDPNWRIFSLFVNPNALAAMLLLGFFVALGLWLTQKRLEQLIAGIAIFAISIAIVLTQSKGAILCLALGGFSFLGLVLAWGREERKRATSLTIAAGVLFAGIFGVLQWQASSATNGAGSRLANVQSTAEQSGEYRKNLWKGAIAMTERNPAGTGIGAYRFDSARPGITPQTHLAHQSYLQLMAEGSPMLLFLLIAIAGMWFFQMFRGARSLPVSQNLLRAGVMSAVVAVGAHSMIDSDFYYYGIGLSFFLLLGLGMLLAGDAVAPENVPKPVRFGGAAASVIIAMMLIFFGQVDLAKARLRGAIQLRDQSAAQATAESLKRLASNDGEAWALLSQMAPPEERQRDLERAVSFAPSTKNLRALARVYVEKSDLAKAAETFRRALDRDPNNLLTLSQLADLEQKLGADAVPTLKRLIAIEDTPYFQVRAIPELVPTETYEARVSLADLMAREQASGNVASRYVLLREAVDGLARYRDITVPKIVDIVKIEPTANFGGERASSAKEKMDLGAKAAREAALFYRSKDKVLADQLEAEATKFDRALDGLK